MTRHSLLTIFTVLLTLAVSAMTKNPNQVANAKRVDNAPKINGILDDACWDQAKMITGFKQYDPDYGQPASQKTYVYIVYDNEAIYVGAFMQDSAPDSILTQLGNRDDGNLNADWFSVEFDTYYNQLDSYTFRVTASGVQIDRRRRDWTYDGVWQSATKMNKSGWVAEIKIPYSAIRFPKQNQQTWGLQLKRYIRRNREQSQWALGVKGAPNQLVYWGSLRGLNDIKPPLRLSVTPYFSISGQHDENIEETDARSSYSFGGGADLKYGINESFTLDMTLFPDFSQVKSDNKIKNLSAFETVYAEQRPFFKEAVDLFKKGGLFYSRRIGGTPAEFGSVDDVIDSTEVIIDNPAKAKLLNATKVSGRNKNGLAMGLMNAITNNTYAIVEDQYGNQREILTDPFTNYNIVVLDQALKNNSSAYAINTSVLRSKGYDDANVTGAGFNLLNKENTYRINASGALSQVFDHDNESDDYQVKRGYKYYTTIGKVSGNFQWDLYRSVMDDQYDDNDLGVTHRNDFVRNGVNLDYFIFEPFWKLRSFRTYVRARRETSFTTGKNLNTFFRYGMNATFLSYLSSWINVNFSVLERYDYYDPRVDGRFVIRPGYTNASWGFSSDYRKPLALDGSIWLGYDWDGYNGKTLEISPRIRVNDQLNFDYRFKTSITANSRGYADQDSTGTIIYGNRDLQSYENVLSGRYMFKNNLSLSLWMRHYWYKGIYDQYYSLNEKGRLEENDSYSQNNDFNFNTFNVDLVFNWEFAPGSNLSVVWKNSILHEDQFIIDSFFDNLNQTLESEQLNQISVKILYYLDYQSVFKNKS